MPYAELPGVRLHYADEGGDEGSGVPVVLLHGIGASIRDWDFQIPALSKRQRVIAPDLRGFGLSEKAGDYRVATFAADVWALLDRLGVVRFNLVGHSMGGAVALQMAVDRPERIERLVAADTLPSFEANTFAKRILFAYRFAMMGVFGPQRLAAAVAQKLFPGPHQAALRERAVAGGLANDRGVYLDTIRNLLGWHVSDRLARLTMPTLVLVAEHDYFPVADGRAFAEAVAGARLKVFKGMHHAVPLEAPRAFNAALRSFFEEKRKPSSRKAAKAPKKASGKVSGKKKG
jgi:pimeloyl-ACP methyl ester carboxylesterase